MSVFSDMRDSGVFKDEDALSTEYMPEMMPHRENDIQLVASNIAPAAKGKKPQNTFIFGPPGIGKTAAVKHVFKEFEDFSERVRCIYINCWDYKTPTALLTQLIIDLGVFVQRRGWSRDEIIGKLTEFLNKSGKALIVCLDEVDQLDPDALYDLLRINQYVKNPVGIIFISNNPHVFAKAEPRIQSSLDLHEVGFKPYTLSEMKDILSERAKLAFVSYDPTVVLLCANHAVNKGGDVRVGLQALLRSGRLAEKKNARKVTVEFAKDAVKGVEEIKPKLLVEKVNEHEKLILSALKAGGEGKKWTSGRLYEKYVALAKKEMGDGSDVSDRSFRDFVNHLGEIGLVEISDKKVGKSRLISLKTRTGNEKE
jgi:archaeal cell division control protein 6